MVHRKLTEFFRKPIRLKIPKRLDDEIDDLRKIGLNDLEIDFIKNLKVKEYISLELTKKNSP
ncbi:MAG TPA: hypothetical protein VJZ93_01755 [Candidatus Nanoarchaeia archaeon]|nr:hypothetical protein [Candidatus Nanoarchaeia archaeon]